jgi:hypothetical protein
MAEKQKQNLTATLFLIAFPDRINECTQDRKECVWCLWLSNRRQRLGLDNDRISFAAMNASGEVEDDIEADYVPQSRTTFGKILSVNKQVAERSFDKNTYNSSDWDADVVLLLECDHRRVSLKQETFYSFQPEVSSTISRKWGLSSCGC